MISKLAWKNIWHNPLSTVLSMMLLSFSVAMISLLIIVQEKFENNYTANLNNIDLVLGAKGSPLQLILSAVYQIDAPTGNIAYKEAQQWMEHPFVQHAVPLAYGDNYQGNRIVGTTKDYMKLYGNDLESGRFFNANFEVVIGKNLAEQLNLRIGDQFYGAHGQNAEGHVHDEHPYTIVGIANPTGKVLDYLILCNIDSVWEMHHHDADRKGHDHKQIEEDTIEGQHSEHKAHEEEEDKQITAVLLKLKNKMGLVTWPRLVANATNMQVASPAIEINRLFSLMGLGIAMLSYLAYGIMILAALSIFISLYTRLNNRKKEFALMRVSGGNKFQLFWLVVQESLFLCLSGYIIGSLLARFVILFFGHYTDNEFHLSIDPMSVVLAKEVYLLSACLILGVLAALIPAVKAYKLNIPKILSYE